MSKLLTIGDAAKTLSVSTDTVRRLIRNRELGHVRISRRVMVPQEEVERVCRQGCGRYARRVQP